VSNLSSGSVFAEGSGLVVQENPQAEQLDLFGQVDAPGSSADAMPRVDAETVADTVLAETIDAIRARFGSAAVGSAKLAGTQKLRVKVAGDTQWGPKRPS
jgi:hypothetical protein